MIQPASTRHVTATRSGHRVLVQTVVHRGPVKPAPKKPITRDAPIALTDLIERIGRIKDQVSKFKGVGRTNSAHDFVEAKSDLFHALARLQDDVRKRGVEPETPETRRPA